MLPKEQFMKLRTEGIRDRIEEVLGNGEYFRYGQLLARGDAAYAGELLGDVEKLRAELGSKLRSAQAPLDW